MDEQQAEIAEQTAPVMPTEEQATEAGEVQEQSDGTSDRTKEQFEKLTEANRRLKEENELLKIAPTQSVLESLRPTSTFPNVSASQAAQIQEQVFDEQGYVDPNLLNQKLAEANRIAQEAIQTAQQAQQQLRNFEETQTTKELYKQYPQLNPNDKERFDPKFYGRVKNEMVGQLMGGKTEDVFTAAQAVTENFSSEVKKQVEDQEAITLKQQASSDLGTGKGTSAPVDHSYLVEETRKGNPDALAERLKKAGF